MAKNVVETKKPKSDIISTPKDFGEHIKHERSKHKITRKQFSQMINISYNTASKVENGFEGIRLTTAINMAKQLGLEIVIRKKDWKKSI